MQTNFKHDQITRKQQKDRADREWDKARELARYAAYKHFGGCCAKCGTPLKLRPSEARHEFEIAHAHEEPRRSLGGDPLNPRCIVILCYVCHDVYDDHKGWIEIIEPELGTFGRLDFHEGSRKACLALSVGSGAS